MLPVLRCLGLFLRGGLPGEERVQMGVDRGARLDDKAGDQRIHRGINQHVRRIEGELAAPDQPGLLTVLDNGLEETALWTPGQDGADRRRKKPVYTP